MKSMLDNQMNSMFAEGGVMQEGGTVDPVSGNDVPLGAMKEEVRDDIDAKLSEGEFVFPADVVRYVGLETLMKIRDKAKMGLKKMEEIGQMGNAEEVPDGEALFGGEDEMDDETFSSEIDSILSEEDGEERGYADGGYVVPDNAKLYRDAPIKGFEMVPMTNDEGQTMYIPYINGVAQLTVPSGYRVRKADEVVKTDTDTKADTTITDNTSGGDGGGDGGGGGSNAGGTTGGGISSGISMGPDGFATANSVNASAIGLAAMAVSAITGIPGLSTVAQSIANTANFNAAQDAMSVNVAVADTTNASNNEGITSNAAISADAAAAGATGVTGGSAAAAGAAAAAAAAADGMSAAAQGAASQAAADATVSGQDSSAAAAAGAAAAADAAAAEGNAAADGVGMSGIGEGAGVGAGGGGIGAGDGGGGIGAGEGLAKGGFVSKKKTSKPTSLASRRK
jgi:hypothetical protein